MNAPLEFPSGDRILAYLEIHPVSAALFLDTRISRLAAARFANRIIYPQDFPYAVLAVLDEKGTIQDWLIPALSKRLAVALLETADAHMWLKSHL